MHQRKSSTMCMCKKGQSIIEYAMVAAIVTAVVVAMSTYVFRSTQATQQMIQKEFRNY